MDATSCSFPKDFIAFHLERSPRLWYVCAAFLRRKPPHFQQPSDATQFDLPGGARGSVRDAGGGERGDRHRVRGGRRLAGAAVRRRRGAGARAGVLRRGATHGGTREDMTMKARKPGGTLTWALGILALAHAG